MNIYSFTYKVEMFDKLLKSEPKFIHTCGVSVRIIHGKGKGELIDWLIG